MAVAVLTKDKSHALGRSPVDGDTKESRWRAQVDSGKYGRVYYLRKMDYGVHLCRPPLKNTFESNSVQSPKKVLATSI